MEAIPGAGRLVLAAKFLRGNAGGQGWRAHHQCEREPRPRQPETARSYRSMLNMDPERRKVGRNDSALAVGGVRRHPVIGHRLRAINRVCLNLLACWSERLRAKIGAHIFPNDLACRRDLEEPAV